MIDERGFIISRGQDRYIWNSNGELMSVTKDDQRIVNYYYDHMKRLVARKESSGNVTQFIYDETQPSKVTHCVMDGRIIGFIYDIYGHLVAMSIEGTKYYVGSDHLGTPVAVFNSDGILVKEIVRNVWGKVIRDSNSGFWLPIDFRGAIRDPTTGLVHFVGGRVYDPLIGQWLTPKWDEIESLVKTPEKLHLYRFYNNDPINVILDDFEIFMTDLSSWLPPMGIDINEIFPKDNSLLVRESVPVISGLECQSLSLLSLFHKLSIAPKSGVRAQNNILGHFHIASLPSTMSSVIISRGKSQTLVTTVESETSPMISSVLMNVFNSTQSLAIYLPHQSQDEFFFIQPDISRSQSDLDQLQRLGSMVNVTRLSDDSSSHTLMASGNLLLNVRYGVTSDEELRRVTRMVRRRAVEEAWKRETNYVRLGFRGFAKTDWTTEERQELLNTGMVSKYFGTDIHGIERYPQLADDPNNVVFRRDSQTRKRRNRLRRQKSSTPYNIMSIVINS
jgi:RHS repeat-associated protein